MKRHVNRAAAMGTTKHMRSNYNIVAKVSKSKVIDGPRKDELWQPSPKNLVDTSSNKPDSTASTRVTCCRNQRFCSCRSCVEYDQHKEISVQLVQKNKAAGPFYSKKSVDGTDQQCKQLLDALGIFNSNKELFINLLQDPNSLLIKHIEDSSDSRVKKQQMRSFFDGTLLENKTRDVQEYEKVVYSQNLKPCDREPYEESDDCESLDRIVVLKPNSTSSQHNAVRINHCSSLQSHSSFINNVQSDKPEFFSFRHIKRKMRQAMRVGRKEGEHLSTHGMSKKTQHVYKALKDIDKQMVMEVNGKSSDSNILFDNEGISSSFQDSEKKRDDQPGKAFYSRNGDQTASTSESTGKNISSSAVTSHLKRKKSKKHEGDKEVSRKLRAKPWGWMICFSDDDILPPMKSGCHTAGHMRYSNFSNKKIVEKKLKFQNEEKRSCETPQMDKAEASLAEKRRDDCQLHGSNVESNISHFSFPDIKVDEDRIIEGSVKTTKDIAAVHQEGNHSFEGSPELNDTCKTDYCHSASIGESGYLELSRLDSPFEVQPSTFSADTFSSISSRHHKVEDPSGLHNEVQPLPVCIHDQLLVDASSSPGFILGAAESPVEDHGPTDLGTSQKVLNPAITTSADCCGSISECVLEQLQASILNWNELSIECRSSTCLRSMRVIDKVKMFNGQLCGDCMLLFDYINEVLEDVFHYYIRCSPWLSSLKAHFQAPDKDRALYHAVMKHVDWPLLRQQPPETLEHLFVRDLTRSRTWIDIPTETEDIVTIIAESVLDDLTIGSIVDLDF